MQEQLTPKNIKIEQHAEEEEEGNSNVETGQETGGNWNDHGEIESVGVAADAPTPLDAGENEKNRVTEEFKRAVQGDGDRSENNKVPTPLPASDAAGGGARGGPRPRAATTAGPSSLGRERH